MISRITELEIGLIAKLANAKYATCKNQITHIRRVNSPYTKYISDGTRRAVAFIAYCLPHKCVLTREEWKWASEYWGHKT